MPEVGTFAGALWLLTIICQPILATVIAGRGAWRRWPSLFAYLAWQSLKSVVLLKLYLGNDPVRYFYAFWRGELIGQLLQAWILIQIARALCGITPAVRRGLTWIVSVAAVVSLIVGHVLAVKVHHDAFVEVMQETLLVERTVSIAWCMTFLFIAFWTGVAGIRWRRELLGLTSGFALESVNSAALAWLLTALGPRWSPILSNAGAVVYLLALYTCSDAIWRRSPKIVLSSRSLETCKQALQRYTTLIARDR